MALKKIKKGDSVKFTRNYTHVSWFGIVKKSIKQGTSGRATRLYTGLNATVTHADIELGDGTRLVEVPARFWTT